MKDLQAELNRLIQIVRCPVAIVFEGRDSAGKSGAIRRVTEYLPPSKYSIHHSRMPKKSHMKNWLGYWGKQLPEPGQITLFDRSWYSRALVQRVNGWCTERQALNFIRDVPAWESAVYWASGTLIIKFWLSISEATQRTRLKEREASPLTYWKYSSNDALALSSYDKMTLAKNDVIDSSFHIVDFNNKATGQRKVLEIICNELSSIARSQPMQGGWL